MTMQDHQEISYAEATCLVKRGDHALQGQRVLTLDTSHSPFFSAPEALLELLLSV
jgi:hypothetical protein